MVVIFYGALVSPKSLTEYDAFPHAVVCVSKAGVIEWVEKDVPATELQHVIAKHGFTSIEAVNLVDLKRGEFIMPGFIDTHTHAPQVPNIGSGQEHELLEWLEQTTFPMEARFRDANFARNAYSSVVRRIIDAGTTTCCYYGTLHLEATKILAEIIRDKGQRAFVGKCNMNAHSPTNYIEPSADASIADTQELISYIRSLSNPLVQPIITPRFAISCTAELLSKLGTLVTSDTSLAIQTHISENQNEITFTKSLFPIETLPTPPPLPGASQGVKPAETTYAGVYDAFGLLRENTILAHGVHLEDGEVELIKARGAGISHCPTSNFNLRSGCAKVGAWLDKGVKVGLGTDVSGGFSPSMLTAVQHASMCSKVIATQYPPPPSQTTGFTSRQLPVATLLYLATLGGASLCNLASTIGSLEAGKAFDALLVSVRSECGNPNLWGIDLDDKFGITGTGGPDGKGKSEKEELKGLLERFLFCGDDRNIRKVWVNGKAVGGAEPHH